MSSSGTAVAGVSLQKMSVLALVANGRTMAMVATPKKQQDVPAALVLPIWPDATRGVPNVILRSALFGVAKPAGKGGRSYMQRALIAATGDIKILQTGPRLEQSDLELIRK